MTSRSLLTSAFAGIAAALVSLGAVSSAYAWEPLVPKGMFSEMTVFERAQYQKAEKLFLGKKYGLAANEFDKFALQFEDSPAVSAVLFLKGYSQLHALKRHTAIKTFYEVIDYFPDDINYAGASMYYIGHAHKQNGNHLEGLKVWRQFVTNKDYKRHTLAAPALKQLAANAYKNKEAAKGHRFRQQIYTDFYAINKREAVAARDALVRAYVKEGEYGRIEALVKAHDWKDARTSHGFYQYLYDQAIQAFDRDYPKAEVKQRGKDMVEFFNYWKQSRAVYAAAKAENTYLNRAFAFALARIGDKGTWEPLCDELVGRTDDENTTKSIMITLISHEQTPKAMKLASRLKSDSTLKSIMATLINNGKINQALPLQEKIDDKQAFYPWLFDLLLKKGEHDFARHIVDKIQDPGLRHWKLYEWASAMKRWKECIEILQKIVVEDEKRSVPANWALAGIYQNRTRQYDDAIKIYTVINEPPRSVWPIAACYKAKGEMNRAAATYSEIENFFPNEAPKAALARARLYDHFGDSKKAIAEYRRILKVYKRSRESSVAHQRLEDYGVKTGGGETR
jgi:tetratricopeptide (TPR) repeat protein